MKNLSFLSVCFFLLFTTSSYAQSIGSSQGPSGAGIYKSTSGIPGNGLTAQAVLSNDNSYSFDVNAQWNVKAEAYLAIFNVRQVAERAEQADSIVNERINNFKKGLKRIGVDSNQIYIDMISFLPNYNWQVEKKIFSKAYNEVPAGFEIQKNVHIRFTNPALLDFMVTEATRNEIYDLAKVEYFIKNQEQILDSLRNMAVKEVMKKMHTYSQLGIDFSIMTKNFGEEASITFPTDRNQNYQAFCRPAVTSVIHAVNLESNAVKSVIMEQPKPTSTVYSLIRPDFFDIVINPVITEPVVQISFNLKVKYTQPPKEQKEQKPESKTIIILTPDGATKELKVN